MRAKDLERARVIVRDHVRQWNPRGLIPVDAGADDDEFSGEINALIRQMERVKSSVDLVHLISRVFTNSFKGLPGFTVADCRDVGERLFEALLRERVIRLDDEKGKSKD